MAPSYSFAIIRFAPDSARGERLNVGTVVMKNDGVDVRLASKLDKIKAISAAADINTLRDLLFNIESLDKHAINRHASSEEDRWKNIAKVGPLSISQRGHFVANNARSYEERISDIINNLVDAEPALKKIRAKKTRLFSQLKTIFRKEKILAKADEGLDSHRVVPTFELADGLIADLVLRNGIFHVIETVDASGDESDSRRAVAQIAVSALVLEQARMRFGKDQTNAQIVYSASAALEKVARPSLDAAAHQGAKLINWTSIDDRNGFLDRIANLATPFESKKRRLIAPDEQSLFH